MGENPVDGDVAVFMSAGAEKLRYITGMAVAISQRGEVRRVSLDDIYEARRRPGRQHHLREVPKWSTRIHVTHCGCVALLLTLAFAASARADNPTVVTGAATVHSDGSVTLTGTITPVNPSPGIPIIWSFDWGPTAEYSEQSWGGKFVPTGSSAMPVSETVPASDFSEANSGSRYHFRLEAVSNDELTQYAYGSDQTFVVPAAPAATSTTSTTNNSNTSNDLSGKHPTALAVIAILGVVIAIVSIIIAFFSFGPLKLVGLSWTFVANLFVAALGIVLAFLGAAAWIYQW